MDNLNNDVSKLIEYCLTFAKQLLNDFQEFYPFACAINSNGELIPVSHYDGNDHPLSNDLKIKLESLLDDQLYTNEKRAYAITYDVHVKRATADEKIDAIAIKIKQHNIAKIIVHYFGYRIMPNNSVLQMDSWYESET